MPLRSIQRYLADLHGLRVSVGELVELLHRVAAHGAPAARAIRDQARRRAVVHADETGWREAGQTAMPGSWRHRRASGTSSGTRAGLERWPPRSWATTSPACWSATSTPATTTHREDGTSAAGSICCAMRTCWPRPTPRICAGQAWKPGSGRQRSPPEKRVRQCVLHPPATPAQRQQLQRRLLLQVQALGDHPLDVLDHPCRALAWRLWHFQQELLTCVAQSGVPPDNNLAEWVSRPLHLARKISGGTQSPHGSATRMQRNSTPWPPPGQRRATTRWLSFVACSKVLYLYSEHFPHQY